MGTPLRNGSTLTTGGSNLPARLSGQDAKAASTTTSVTATYPGSTTAGNLLIATVYGNASGAGSLDISGWTSAAEIGINSGGVGDAQQLGLFYKVASGSETTVQATQASASVMKIHIYEYQNVKNPIVLDVAGTANGNTGAAAANHTTTAITTTNSRALIFACAGVDGDVTNAASGTFGIRQTDTAIRLIDADYIPDALQTSLTNQFTWTTSRRKSGIVIAFIPSWPSSSDEPGMKITFHASAPAAQFAYQIYDYLNAPVWVIGNSDNPGVVVFGDRTQAENSGDIGVGFDGRGARADPAGMFFPISRSSAFGPRVFSGSGAPAVDTAVVGDIWIRTDTPLTANQRVYHCTTAGNPGTWTARL